MMPSPAGPSLFDELEKGLISDIRANDLLTELHRGLSPEGLRPALRAERDEVVKTAVWILAELAGGGFALWDELPRLFRHTDKRVRYWAVDAAHHAVPSDPVMLAEVAALVGDSEFVVAWRALKLVVTASDEQVEAAARTFPALGVLLSDASSPTLRSSKTSRRWTTALRWHACFDRLAGELISGNWLLTRIWRCNDSPRI